METVENLANGLVLIEQEQAMSTVPIDPPVIKRQMSVIAKPVSMSWHNIDVFSTGSNGLSLPFKKKKVKPVVHILKNVSGQVKSGQLLAMMGASGAGKTTLINVLTQRNLSNVDVKGSVRLNGRTANVNNIIALSAYVQQDDLFIGSLTVKEHLKFQSRVRMDMDMTKDIRKRRAEEVMIDLGLSKCADTVIGNPGDVKGISGGERKRLSFASEVRSALFLVRSRQNLLLTNPSIMFCDEPTSGLDSFTSLSVVEVLRGMAESGRTIICTIHQPSSEVFSLFDHLLLMADGRVAYLGKLVEAIDYFSSVGLHCPINYNPADFYIQQLAIIPGKETDSKEKVKKICDQYLESTYVSEAMPKQNEDQLLYSPLEEPDIQLSLYKSNWINQFWPLLWRSMLTVLRDPMITSIQIMQSVFISIILGLIFWRLDVDQTGIMNINGALFLLITNMNFIPCFAIINTFSVELPIFLREHNNGMYRVSTYFMAKMLAELPTFLMITILFVTIFYNMVGLGSNFMQFLVCAFVSLLVANCASSFGYFVSCISSNVTMALSIAPPMMIPMFIFGGFFLNTDSVPVYFIWLKYISWFYYGNEALVINQWQTIDHIVCKNHTIEAINQTMTTICIPNGKVVIKSLNFSEDNFNRDIGALFATALVLRVMTYIALLVRSRKR